MPEVAAGTALLTFGGATVTSGGAVSPISPTGPPSYPFRLFHGQVTNPQLEWSSGILHVTLDCRDYNRLWNRIKVGIPIPGDNIDTPNGPVAEDPAAAPFGDGSGLGDGSVLRYLVGHYWPGAVPSFADIRQTNPVWVYRTALEAMTARTDLGAYWDRVQSYQDPYARRHLDADHHLWYRKLAPIGLTSDQAVAAPFSICGDLADRDTLIVPANIRPSWDIDRLRRRLFVQAATEEASVWATNPAAPIDAGEEYIDALGATTATEANAIGTWHLANKWRAFLTATAEITLPVEPWGNLALDGWRVGQTLYAKDPQLARYTTHPISDGGTGFLATIITGVTGRFAAPPPAGALSVSIGGVTLDDHIQGWEAFTFTETGFAQVGTAHLELWLWDPAQTIAIADLAEIIITKTSAAPMIYTLTFGDVEPGSLSAELARDAVPAGNYDPGYHFSQLYEDPNMPPGGSSKVTFQLLAAADKPLSWPGFSALLTMECLGDELGIVVSDEYTLDDDGSTIDTNNLGQVYSIVRRVATPTTPAVKWDVSAIYVPPA